MTELTKWDDSHADRQIDALVDGELTEEQRAALLGWLEADVSRWRKCALAFLEVQLWDQALEGGEGSEGRVQGSAAHETNPTEALCARRERMRSWLMPLVVLAASIAAFLCGLYVHDLRTSPQSASQPMAGSPLRQERPHQPGELVVASVPVQGGALGHIAATLQIPVRPVDATAASAASSVPDHVRKQWERRGYQLVEQRRYLPARLPDGRKVMVPVNEVKMKFVGKPVS